MISTKSIKNYIRQAVTVTALAFCGLHSVAAVGIGDDGKSKKKAVVEFTPIRLANSFTLKSNVSNYKGSMLLNTENVPTVAPFNNAVVTFQQGNTTYILPYRNNVNLAPLTNSSNLEMLKLKVNIHR